MTEDKKSIRTTDTLRSYFSEELFETAQKQGLSPSPEALDYLAQVLTKFSDRRQYFREEKEGTSFPVLAQIYLESASLHPGEQYFQLLHLGDLALFTSGFFAERLERSRALVDRDYYAAMGGMAYRRAGHLRNALRADQAVNIFFELSSGFDAFRELFSELSEKSRLHTDRDLLRLYEKWLVSHSHHWKRLLAERGVIAGSHDPQDGNS